MITLGVATALLASVGYGLSDVLSGTVVRRHATAALALWAQTTGLFVLGVAALARRPDATAAGLAVGGAAGVIGAVGVLLYYTALQRGRTSVVAPVAGVGVVLPVGAGLLAGEALSGRAAGGIVIAVLGVVVVAASADDDGAESADPGPTAALGQPVPGRTQRVPAPDGCVPSAGTRTTRSPVWLAVAAALAFGAFFVVLEEATTRAPTSAGSVLDTALAVSLSVQVGALLVTVLAATRHGRACLRPERALAVPASAIGLLDVGADLLVTVAVDRGPLAVVGPLASLDPVVAVLVAATVLRERVRPWPALGIALALLGIVLVAWG